MGYFIAFTVVAGFGYFIYTRVRSSNERTASAPRSGGGGRSNDNVHEK